MTVYLVGAGPGDPGLVTVRGRELVERCDAIVYDRLADPRTVALAPEDSEKVYAGKRPGEHAMTQERLNAVLVELGGRLETVVRLKGGDPFVFGRGGEEALALEGAGIAFEIVPGVSSAHAVPAYAGIPVTQRGTAAQVTFVTGHEDPTRPESAIDWASLAATPGTLVFLMGVGALEENARRLIAHGMRADTPAAVISHGTRPDQRTVTAPLARIAEAASELPAPAITVVGEVALLREHLAWFERRPLHGVRVVVTRARAQASGLRCRLEELGAEVTEAPAIRIEPLPFEPPDLSAFDLLVLTSANGVDRILPADVRALAGVTVAAIGSATAETLRARGIVADVVPTRAVGEALLEELGDVRGRRCLVAAAEGARDVLPEGLSAGGADVTVLHTYRSVPEPVDPDAVLGADLVTFTSSSTVANLARAMDGRDLSGLRAVSIGPVTSASLREAGIEPVAEADPHDVPGLVEAVLAAAGRVPEIVSPARYDGLADWYDTWSERPAVASFTAEAIAAVLRLLGPGPGRCLDVGCGGGRLVVELADARWTATGADLSADQLRIAELRAGERAEALVQTDAASLPFADGAFDAVVSTFTHTDVDEPEAAFGECARVLARGGRLVYAGTHPCFVGPYAHPTDDGVLVPPGYWDRQLRFDAPGFGDGVRRLAGARHVPLADLLNHVSAAGLSLDRVEEVHGDPPGILAFRASKR